MASIDERHPEFRDSLKRSTYPFASTVSLTNESGRFVPQEAFVDASLYPLGISSRLYLATVTLDGTTVRMGIADADGVEVCAGAYEANDLPETLELQDEYGRPAGLLVFDTVYLAAINAWGVGAHQFQIEQTEFCAGCLIPQPQTGVRGVLVNGELLTGQVWLVAGRGVRFSLGTGEDGRTAIRTDILGDPLFRRAFCDDEDGYTAPKPIRALRIFSDGDEFEIFPNALGAIRIYTGRAETERPALTVKPGGSGLVICILGSLEKEA